MQNVHKISGSFTQGNVNAGNGLFLREVLLLVGGALNLLGGWSYENPAVKNIKADT